MKKLVSTINLSKSEWLRYRKQGITGTDAGAIVGLNPYVSAFQVYQDKISDSTEDMDNEAMRQGRDLENYVAERFSEETGYKVRRANAVYQNEKYPFMLADFDRLIIGLKDGKKAGLECKTVSPYAIDKWKDGAIPFHYQMQVQHYLAVSGYDCWYIAALIFGREFIVRRIDRDEELIQNLIKVEEHFWNKNILARSMPDPDGSESCSKMIEKLYFKADTAKCIKLSGCKEMLTRRQELDELIKKMEKEKSAIDQKIKLEMKEATSGISDGYRVSWAPYVQKRLDSKRLKEEKPEIYDQYCKSNTGRRFLVSSAA